MAPHWPTGEQSPFLSETPGPMSTQHRMRLVSHWACSHLWSRFWRYSILLWAPDPLPGCDPAPVLRRPRESAGSLGPGSSVTFSQMPPHTQRIHHCSDLPRPTPASMTPSLWARGPGQVSGTALPLLLSGFGRILGVLTQHTPVPPHGYDCLLFGFWCFQIPPSLQNAAGACTCNRLHWHWRVVPADTAVLPDQGAPGRTQGAGAGRSTLTRPWTSGAHRAARPRLPQGRGGPRAAPPPPGLGPLRPPLSPRALVFPCWSPGLRGGRHLASTWGNRCGGGSCGAAGCPPRRTRGWAWARGLCSQTRGCWVPAKRLGPTRGRGPGCREQTPGDTQHLCHLRRSRGEQQAEGQGAWQRLVSPRPPPQAPPCAGSTACPSFGQ